MSSITVDFDDLDNITADVILADGSLEIVPEGLKVSEALVDLINSTVGTQPAQTTEVLTYDSFGGVTGVVYRLGTNFGVLPFENPHVAGRCVVVRSSSESGTAADLTDRIPNNTYSISVPNSWIVIDLGASRKMVVNQYTLRNRSFADRAIRNWKLQGTNDGGSNSVGDLNAAVWTDLDIKINNTTMPALVNAWALYSVSEGITTPFRKLRILQTGVNSGPTAGGPDNYLTVAEMEFYGTFIYGPLYADGSLVAFQDQNTLRPLADDLSAPVTPGTRAGWIKISLGGASAWIPYYR